VVAAGGGDAGVAGEPEDGDGEVAQGGHHLGSVAGADLGGVFVVGDITDVVKHFDLPVAADPAGQLGRGGLGHGQAGDRVDGDGAPLPAGQGPDPAGQADGLGGVREGQPGGDGRGLEGAVLLAAVPAATLAVSGRDAAPGQVLELGIQARLVLFTSRM
jgi:hypothetical protein